MANPSSAPTIARLSPRKGRGQAEITFALVSVYADSQGQIICRSDPGTVPGDLAAGTGERLRLIFPPLPYGLPQPAQVAP